MNNIFQLGGYTFDLSTVENIGPIENDVTPYSDKIVFHVYLRSICMPVYAPKSKRKLLEGQHQTITNAIIAFNSSVNNSRKHYLIQWEHTEYAKHEDENDLIVQKCKVGWYNDEELESFCKNLYGLKVTHLG